MILESKFGNGDVVYHAQIGDGRKTVPCHECSGAGRLKIEGKSYTVDCRMCAGSGHYSTHKPVVDVRKLTIGRVGVQITESRGISGESTFDNYMPQHKRREEYMALETGVGSGSLYYAETLFATREEAQLYGEGVLMPQWVQTRKEYDERQEQIRLENAKRYQDECAAESAA